MADAQKMLDKLNMAVANGTAEVPDVEMTPKLYPPRSFPRGALATTEPGLARDLNRKDDGNDVFVVLRCGGCNPRVMGIPFKTTPEYIILAYRRDTPGATYMGTSGSKLIRRLTGDMSIPDKLPHLD
jgi:hypothetical protein